MRQNFNKTKSSNNEADHKQQERGDSGELLMEFSEQQKKEQSPSIKVTATARQPTEKPMVNNKKPKATKADFFQSQEQQQKAQVKMQQVTTSPQLQTAPQDAPHKRKPAGEGSLPRKARNKNEKRPKLQQQDELDKTIEQNSEQQQRLGAGEISAPSSPTSDSTSGSGESSLSSSASSSNENICAACLKPIKERYLLMALDKQWHEDCLKCACCDCRLGEVGSSLFTHSDKILCRRDFLRIFGQHGHCAACNKSIPPYEMVMRANQNAYHMDCFACQQCQYRFCVGDRFHLTEAHRIVCVLCHAEQKQQHIQQPKTTHHTPYHLRPASGSADTSEVPTVSGTALYPTTGQFSENSPPPPATQAPNVAATLPTSGEPPKAGQKPVRYAGDQSKAQQQPQQSHAMKQQQQACAM